jgi:uncharacterized repeat protein (TIGR03803 family)
MKILRVGWVLGGFLSLVLSMPAQTFTTLHSFDGPDGGHPRSGLVQATNGNLYGTTADGGPNSAGTVFKITPSGTLTTLYSFCSQSGCSDGANASAGLVQATNGELYGTTTYGGANNDGTVFKITPSGTLTTLHSFAGADGYGPNAGLVQATNGNLYGTTTFGGASNTCPDGCGTIFKITPSGTLTTLHSFDGTDGAYPWAGLVQATNGNLYGTTAGGGEGNCRGGCGMVFKITPSGTLTTLYSFDGRVASTPYAGLVQATNGNLYGTTAFGGSTECRDGGCGTIFKITPSGTLTTLYSFSDTDGPYPWAGLVQATNGNLYGTTADGGPNSAGTVFEITPSGTLTTLYNFCSQNGCTDGDGPKAGLVQDTNGTVYGTTTFGGTSNTCASGCGTIFSLSVGRGPFVEIEPTSGKVGTVVVILGTNLTGATSVTFNGTAAKFTVVSKSEIKTTVPTGGTTGPVEVKTPRGTIKSNVVFRLIR